jgi:hypothetical protein
MSDDAAIRSYDRGLWPTRYTAHERVSLRVQSANDRRNVPLKWYWRYLTDQDEGGAAPDDTYYENPAIYRKFDGPHGVHLLVDDTVKQKGAKRGTVEVGTEGEVRINISRAECARLGAVFGVKDDREATLATEETHGHEEGPFKASQPLFIPRAGDVFLFRRKHHRIAQMEPDYEMSLSPQGTVMAWKGTATMLRMDATFPEVLRSQLVPPTSDPVVPRAGRDVSWPG